jgi:ferredoxin
MAKITKVVVEDTCIACEACVDVCPDVFEMGDDIAVVKSDVDEAKMEANEDGIVEAAEQCPVDAIKYE